MQTHSTHENAKIQLMSRRKYLSLCLMSILYVLAGINHFLNPRFYLDIMPDWIPAHQLVVNISGWAEIILGALLLIKQTRRLAAWGIILLLIAVFPANIQMFLDFLEQHHRFTWIAVLRLPLQALLIYWAFLFTRRHTTTITGNRR